MIDASSPVTQRLTFERIVLLITQYPGLRSIFCCQKHLANLIREEIANSWKRDDWNPEPEWEFFRELAGFALQTTFVSDIIEEPKPSALGSVKFEQLPSGESSLNPVPIERLLQLCRYVRYQSA